MIKIERTPTVEKLLRDIDSVTFFEGEIGTCAGLFYKDWDGVVTYLDDPTHVWEHVSYEVVRNFTPVTGFELRSGVANKKVADIPVGTCFTGILNQKNFTFIKTKVKLVGFKGATITRDAVYSWAYPDGLEIVNYLEVDLEIKAV